MDLLSFIRCSSFTCPNSPDWLISNHNSFPVINLISKPFKLVFDHLISDACFSVLKHLADTHYGVKSGNLSLLHFFCNNFISLTVVLASLRVSDYGPSQAEVFHLISSNFSSEGSLSCG